jgi:MFS family permease
MFVGIGEAALSPAAYSLLADRFPRNRLTTAISIYTMGIKVGSASAFALGGVVIALAASLVVARPELSGLSGWQLVFMATGLPAVLLALLVFTFPEPPRRGVRRAAGAAPDTIIRFMLDRKRLFVPMLIGFSLISLCSYSLNGWVPTYLDRHFGMKPIAYGPLLGAISMAAALTLAVKGAFVDWLYSRGMKDAHLRFYTWLLMGALPVAATLFFVESPAVFLVMYGALQVVAIPIIAYMSAAMQLITPSDLRGRITAVFLFCLTVLGGGVGPLLVSAITDYVFHDDAKVGWSLALVTATTMPLALISLRLALKPLAAAVVEAEQRDRAPA